FSRWRHGGADPDWVILDGTSGQRIFSNPRANSMPAAYGGVYFTVAAGTDPHVAATVGDHWLYLLAKGGFGKNDLGPDYDADPIGGAVAFDLVGRTILRELTPITDYAAAREATIDAATFGAGFDLTVVESVKAAWDAVNVRDDDPGPAHYPSSGDDGIPPW